MINIRRTPCPDILKIGLVPASKGETETRNNMAGVARIYKVYADKTVRKALKEMFQGKCAYCESRITTIHSGDIEHFRPKGGGYYWLAADWENLLFACPFCNQTYTHEISVNGSIKEIVQGKLNQFPLYKEEGRLRESHAVLFFSPDPSYGQAFQAEEAVRLLISPCIDPAVGNFFRYNDQGMILARDGLGVLEQKKAETSIRVYALQRVGLVLAREARAIQIRAQIRRVEEAIERFNAHFEEPEALRAWYEGRVREEMEALRKFMDAREEYAGLARFIIGRYFEASGLG